MVWCLMWYNVLFMFFSHFNKMRLTYFSLFCHDVNLNLSSHSILIIINYYCYYYHLQKCPYSAASTWTAVPAPVSVCTRQPTGHKATTSKQVFLFSSKFKTHIMVTRRSFSIFITMRNFLSHCQYHYGVQWEGVSWFWFCHHSSKCLIANMIATLPWATLQ